jgi:hypothetical protein
MPLMPQDLVHKLEMQGGVRYIRAGLGALAVLLLVVLYNFRAYHNMSNPEAMDAAQVARNLAQGKGYTTSFVRPFSMFLLKQRYLETHGTPPVGTVADMSRIKQPHPDIANPPVYPVALAALMKILPFNYSMDSVKPFWTNHGRFWRHQPDFLITLFNQVLLLATVVLVFLWARRLFDAATAGLATVLVLCNELLWRFSVSGLSTLLLLLLFMLLVWCLQLLEGELREPKAGAGRLFWLAAAAGLLSGLSCLTRYSFGWLILPVLLFVLLLAGSRKWMLGLIVAGVFAITVVPWMARNHSVCGASFGTAGYSMLENSALFPGDRLQRSLEPNLHKPVLWAFWQKLATGSRLILQNDLPKLGGSWLGAFFLVGLLSPLQHPGARRLRYFLVACIVTLALAQALGRTQLSEISPEINSENLLVPVVPLVVVYGVDLFYRLLSPVQLPFIFQLPFFDLRTAIIALFAAIMCLPMVLTFVPPKTNPIAYPPYLPPAIQSAARWTGQNEWMMSDVPWAVAWYGQAQCVWLTPSPADLIQINDYEKPLQALYLTPVTTDGRFLTQWVPAGEQSWGPLILDTARALPRARIAWQSGEPQQVNLAAGEPGAESLPFPLHWWQPSGWPAQILLTSRQHLPKSL